MTNLLEVLRQEHRKELSAVIEMLDLSDKDQFRGMMVAAFRWYGLSAIQLAEDEDISQAAISKWVNGQATPPRPARKTVRNWIMGQLSNHP